MKPLFILLTILSSFFVQSAKANDEPVTSAVLRSFQTSFKDAKEVQWKIGIDFIKVEFVLEGQYITAFYAAEGKLIAVTKNISSTQLPIVLQAQVKKEYNDYWITELFELSNEELVEYYITVENADTKLVLKSAGSGWVVFQKKSKN